MADDQAFALCWNNFTDNITTGFQSLLVQGDLCDVTLAVEGKLLKAHKVVLSICSPYFQEIFLTMNQNQHPVLILKDTSAMLVSQLLQFMYQGSTNVNQDELQAFMKIAETLKIKGLTTNTKETKSPSKTATNEKTGTKRCFESDELPKYKVQKTEIDLTAEDDAEFQKLDDQFELIQAPEVTLVESQFETSSKSRESNDAQLSCGLKIIESHSVNNFSSYDFSNEGSLLTEIPNKPASATHTEIPNEVPSSGTSITMLSSTSLLHGNCIFNRNNTVATQAGLKTYWLCKSYRISMCKARCITHQGKVISATGVHNHLPHMSNKPQEIPPGHTPNVYVPPPEYAINSNSMPSLSLQQSGQVMNQMPYQYLSPQMMDLHSQVSADSRHVLQPIASAATDTKMSSRSSQINFKVEQM